MKVASDTPTAAAAVDLRALSGVGYVMITPFDPSQALDKGSLARLVEFALESGVSALVPLGIMGESDRLSDREREAVIDVVVRRAARRVPVIVGCSAESTMAAVERARRAHELGADAAMVAPPRFATSAESQLDHYARACSESPIPVVVQDEPVTTGVTMAPVTIRKVMNEPMAVAVKVEDTPTPAKITRLLTLNPAMRCFGGLGGLYLLEELQRGAVGVMTGFGVPDALVGICRDFRDGAAGSAASTFMRYLSLMRYEAQLGVGGVAFRKQLLVERGVIDHPTTRGPQVEVDELTIQDLRRLADAAMRRDDEIRS